MARGEKHGNREAKKPKKEKPKVLATAFKATGMDALKTAGSKNEKGKGK